MVAREGPLCAADADAAWSSLEMAAWLARMVVLCHQGSWKIKNRSEHAALAAGNVVVNLRSVRPLSVRSWKVR